MRSINAIRVYRAGSDDIKVGKKGGKGFGRGETPREIQTQLPRKLDRKANMTALKKHQG
jgi:hypothetical protein